MRDRQTDTSDAEGGVAPPELSPELAELVAAARRDGRVAVGRFSRAELAPVGLDVQLDDGLEVQEVLRRAIATATARRTVAPGPLANLLALTIEHRRTSATWRVQALDAPAPAVSLWHLVVLALRERDVVVVQRRIDDALEVELVRRALLADELAQQAFRAPLDEAERAAGPGTVAIFIGPDRRAQAVPTRVEHHWDKPRAMLVRWSYTLFGGRRDGDWVGRREQKLRGAKPERVAQHLAWRLGKPDPSQKSR